jgi:uncharacterized membrane protein YhiD involved in acid resistance
MLMSIVAGTGLALAALGTPSTVARVNDVQAQPIPSGEVLPESTLRAQLADLPEMLIRLPLAAALGALLAFRPRRRGTPARSTAVLQTQIILAIVGAVVMLVVGSSVARAFGIVGAASLVRYRAKIDDPKDAGIMLSTLGIGLASGVGLYFLAAFATVFIMLVVGLLESFEPEGYKLFSLKIKANDTAKLRPAIQTILRRSKVRYELRSAADNELVFEAKVPATKKTDRITDAIHSLGGPEETAVEWEEKKEVKK